MARGEIRNTPKYSTANEPEYGVSCTKSQDSERRIDVLEERLDAILKQIGALEEGFGAILKQFGALEERFVSHKDWAEKRMLKTQIDTKRVLESLTNLICPRHAVIGDEDSSSLEEERKNSL